MAMILFATNKAYNCPQAKMPELNFSPFPAFETERLQLRRLQAGDAAAIMELRTDDRVNKFITRKKCTGIQEAYNFIEKINGSIENNKALYWAVCLKNNPGLIGTICLWNFEKDNTVAEVGYELHPDFQGKGLAAEGVGAVLSYVFNVLNLNTVEAFVHRGNTASLKLIARFGFVANPARADEHNSDNRIFELQRTAYQGILK